MVRGCAAHEGEGAATPDLPHLARQQRGTPPRPAGPGEATRGAAALSVPRSPALSPPRPCPGCRRRLRQPRERRRGRTMTRMRPVTGRRRRSQQKRPATLNSCSSIHSRGMTTKTCQNGGDASLQVQTTFVWLESTLTKAVSSPSSRAPSTAPCLLIHLTPATWLARSATGGISTCGRAGRRLSSTNR